MELSHTYISNNGTIGKYVPEWIKNRGWNLRPMWGSEHALVDPQRYRFMNAGWKEANPLPSTAVARLWGRMPVSHRMGAIAIVGTGDIGGGYVIYVLSDGDD